MSSWFCLAQGILLSKASEMLHRWFPDSWIQALSSSRFLIVQALKILLIISVLLFPILLFPSNYIRLYQTSQALACISICVERFYSRPSTSLMLVSSLSEQLSVREGGWCANRSPWGVNAVTPCKPARSRLVVVR